MARPRALSNVQVFELADSLASQGVEPSIMRLAELAKERFSASPSYSTLKDSLEEWRRLGGGQRPKGMSRQFLEAILQAFGPLYEQLVEQVRTEHEPQLVEAWESAAAARQELMRSEGERHRQEEEVIYLRGLVEKSAENDREHGRQLAVARAEAERAAALVGATQAQVVSLSKELEQARERVSTLESQLSALLTRRTELDQRYESLIDHLQKQQVQQPTQSGGKP